MIANAIISKCGLYRYVLTRTPDQHTHKQNTCFIMLNPSTADANDDDPTIRRCLGFAKSWGHRNLVVGNLYALRATNPDVLQTVRDPVGPDNDYQLTQIIKANTDLVCAWGNHANLERVQEFVNLVEFFGARLWCLGTTKSGMPKHPLYIKADQPLIKWELKQ